MLFARLAVDGIGALQVGLAVAPFLTGQGRSAPPDRAAGRADRRAGPADRAAGRAVARRTAALGGLTGAAWAGAALLALWLGAAEAGGVDAFRLRPGVLADFATEVAAGRALLLTLGCALLVAVTRLVSFRASAGGRAEPGVLGQPEPVIGFALLGVVAGPVTGHAGGHLGHGTAVPVLAVHVAAACLWAGGLAALALVCRGRPGLLTDLALPRFSRLAGYCAGCVLLTGVLSAAFQLPAPSALLDSEYGRLVLAKAAGFAVVLGLGWWTRRRLAEGNPRLTGRVALELVWMAGVFAVAAALAEAPAAAIRGTGA
ncbi:hypothetical protein GCM10023321_20340 [Pseudonocardia eucalypti]|uniref:Copper resistance protein D domain-containing protein n=1 Tax=Pseudonocardia eucalypti TaxID=648755 RepID=A0ABP9PTX5_9PSEU|nr:putative copper resistance protein D [Pseudonocardia eucalypti]